jgi:hypothetical protein
MQLRYASSPTIHHSPCGNKNREARFCAGLPKRLVCRGVPTSFSPQTINPYNQLKIELVVGIDDAIAD